MREDIASLRQWSRGIYPTASRRRVNPAAWNRTDEAKHCAPLAPMTPAAKPDNEQAKLRCRPSFVATALLTYLVFYAAVSLLPFTLHAIYMIDELKFTYALAALTLGLYCFGRLLGAHLAGMYVGSVTMILGTAAGAVAWTSILCVQWDWAWTRC